MTVIKERVRFCKSIYKGVASGTGVFFVALSCLAVIKYFMQPCLSKNPNLHGHKTIST